MFLNRTTLIGFTGQEPKMFATRSGKEMTSLSVATTRRYQHDSEWTEKTQWHDCVLYGKAAQSAANLPKGTHVYIEGELTYREYNRAIESESRLAAPFSIRSQVICAFIVPNSPRCEQI